ncbi:TolC family protein [Aquirufa sp. KTFRIE-69F]|uniref:TolC family protein n=1 Tax=Aquirufa originis TaxID=3096514 RepID=A0ABW6D7P4_9BACT
MKVKLTKWSQTVENKFIVLIIILFSGFWGKAQQRFSLTECIDYAYKQNFDVKLKELKSKQSEYALEQSQKVIYPNVSGIFSQGINFGRSIDPFTNDFVQQTISSNSFGANATITLFNGFLFKNQIIQNRYIAESDQVDIIRAKNELRNRVTLAYMQVQVNIELAKIAQEQIQNIQLQYSRVKALVSEGNMPKFNLIDLDAQLSSAEYEVLNSKNNIEISKHSLAQLIALPNFETFDIENDSIVETSIQLNDTYLQNILSSSYLQPIIKGSELRLRGLITGVKLAEAAKYPTVSLGTGFGSAYSSIAGKEYNYFNQLGVNLNQFARLTINLPIYSNGQVKSRILNAQINRRIAETQLSQTKLQTKHEIEQAFFAAKIAQEKLRTSQRQVISQQIAYDSGKDRYLEGLINAIDLNTFSINLKIAKSNLIQSKYEFYYRKTILDYYSNW